MGCEVYLPKKLAAEFIGTMGLIIAVIGSVMLVNIEFGTESTIFNALVQGLAGALVLFAMIEALGKISGGHFNPAVTLAMIVTRDTNIKTGACYMVAQILGGFFGIVLLNIMFQDYLSAILVINDVSIITEYRFISEILCTFLLVAVVYGCVRSGSKLTSLAVGATVGGLIMATSSTFYANPAVSIARVFAQSQDGIAPIDAAGYIVASIIGALIAAALLYWLYPREKPEES